MDFSVPQEKGIPCSNTYENDSAFAGLVLAISDTGSIKLTCFLSVRNVMNEVLCVVQKVLWLHACVYSSKGIVCLFFPLVALSESKRNPFKHAV